MSYKYKYNFIYCVCNHLVVTFYLAIVTISFNGNIIYFNCVTTYSSGQKWCLEGIFDFNDPTKSD